MFTGIVEELGEFCEFADSATTMTIKVRGGVVTSDARHGDSINVNGVCLTVVRVDGDVFWADVIPETLRRSTFGELKPGARVNLERAATLATRLGGHLVQGHVDGVGAVLDVSPGERYTDLRVALPPGQSRYVVEKGSIAVDGVSLTVVSVTDKEFTVSLIPTTLELTTLGRRRVGDLVNLEVDVFAKYVEKLVSREHA